MTFSVWELTGLLLVSCRSRFELCVVIQTTEAQFLDDTGSSLSVRVGSEREPNSGDLHVTFVPRAGTGRTRRPVLKSPGLAVQAGGADDAAQRCFLSGTGSAA